MDKLNYMQPWSYLAAMSYLPYFFHALTILVAWQMNFSIDLKAQVKTGKPNIIFILADDLGYGDVSALNTNGKIRTPNIDALAASGMTFTSAHAPVAVCSPTRYGFLTGRYAFRSALKKGVLKPYQKPI